MIVVISQPMFFPWAGLFEQVRLSDIFIHYDDVQIPQGRGFNSRVQIKTLTGSNWLTVPIRRDERVIKNVRLDNSRDWRSLHLKTLEHAYRDAPYVSTMMQLVEGVYARRDNFLVDLNCAAFEQVARLFGFSPAFSRSSEYGVQGRATKRLIALLKKVEASVYITGHGAKNYLDHTLMEKEGIRVEYMDYKRLSYPQLHGPFTPFVSILDLIANCGQKGEEFICSDALYWRDFLDGRESQVRARS